MINDSAFQTSEMIACEKLRLLILRGELPVNAFLSQRMLAERVESTLATVRGALRSLENQGLIESVPRWGVRIPLETEASVRDRYFVRELLEVAAVERMLARKTPSHRQALVEKAEQCDAMAGESLEDAARFAELHFDFHHAIAEFSGSKLLVETLDRFHLRTLMFWNARRGWARGLDRVQHVEFVRRLFEGGEGQAREAMKDHIRLGLDHELRAILPENASAAGQQRASPASLASTDQQ